MPSEDVALRDFFPSKRLNQLSSLLNMDRSTILMLHDFLEKTAETNEATEFDNSQEYLVEQLIALVKAKGKTSIVEDFETPFVHPMITVQKWAEELKLIVGQALHEDMVAGFGK